MTRARKRSRPLILPRARSIAEVAINLALLALVAAMTGYCLVGSYP